MSYREIPEESWHDLGLDALTEKVAAQPQEEPLLRRVMMSLTADPAVAAFRSDVFDDILRHPEIRERLLKLLGEIGDKQGNKFDLTGYDVTYIDAIGHRHIVKPLTAEEREELRKRREAEMTNEQVKNPTMWASGKNPHKHYGGRQDPKDYAKKKKAKRRQQKQARHRNK